LVIAVAAAYTAGALFAFSGLNAPLSIAVLFPPAGVSVAALILSARRDWPWVLATVFATEMAVDTLQGYALPAALGFATAKPSSHRCPLCLSAGCCRPRWT
jgi:hypothetical protein